MRRFEFGFLTEAERIAKDKTLDNYPFARLLMVQTCLIAEAICWSQIAFVLRKAQQEVVHK
jgi:hypothetical protein